MVRIVLSSFIFLCGMTSIVQAQDNVCTPDVKVPEMDLMNFIFQRYANYRKEARPIRNASKPIVVKLAIRVLAVHELIEKQNTLTFDGYLKTSWLDEYINWDKEFPYNCTRLIVFPVSFLWRPDVLLINSPKGMQSMMADIMQGATAFLSSDGTVLYEPGGLIVTTCDVDVTYFPFDHQVCHVGLESWSYDSKGQLYELYPDAFVQVVSVWVENKQWDLIGNYTRTTFVNYSGPELYSRAEFTFILKRKTLFYTANVIVPSVIISVVELATFVLPIGEVLKIHISFTCLLAYSVFQGMVIADLPRAGDSVPLLTLYIDLQMAYIGLIALMGEAAVFLLIRKADLKKRSPPNWILSSALLFGRMFRVEYRTELKLSMTSDSSSTEDTSVSSVKDKDRTVIPSRIWFDLGSKRSHSENSSNASPQIETNSKEDGLMGSEEIRNRWLYVAEVVERCNMFAYISAVSLTPLIMFTLIPNFENSQTF